MNQTTTEGVASIDLAQLDSLQRYADSCVPTALPSEKLGALIALARRSLTSGAPADKQDEASERATWNYAISKAAEGCERYAKQGLSAKECAEMIRGMAHLRTPSADWVNEVVRDICELGERDSPSGQPDMLLVTVNELHDIIARHAPSAGAAAKTDQDDEIRGPLTDAQREECRTLYNNLKHLQCGGIYVADDVIRRAAVFGYMNGRKDFGTPAPAAGAGSAQPEALNEIFAAIDEAQRMNRYNESSFEIASRVARLKCLADNYRAAMRANDGAAEGGSQK